MNTQCDDKRLIDLLQSVDGDPVDGTADTAQHIESCQHCQLRIEVLAAGPEQWQLARDVLTSEVDLDHEHDFDGHWNPRRDNPAVWTEAMQKQLLTPPSHPEMLGRIGRYEVERLIGSGGMGVVFKAYDTELNRPVAVKLLAPYLASSGGARQRFAREARAAAAVVDDHVVPIHNVETESEHPFLVMQYIAGGSLRQRLDREGPLEVCEVLRIGLQTAKGLAAAHAQGLIHRDVKPSNILLDEGVERALLTDFGLARATDDASLTRSGFHPGTPHYMSPEQVRGEAIDARSDLFGLGCVLYALCTGHPPFRSESSYAVLRRITDDTPRSIRETNSDIPEWLERIVMKLLAKSADDRFDSAAQVAELLEDCLAHVHQPTEHPLPPCLSVLTPQRSRLASIHKVVVGAAFAFLAIFASIVFLELSKGTIRIETNSEADVVIRITQGAKTVDQLTVSQGGAKTRLLAGRYKIEVDGDATQLQISGDKVTLERGGTWIAKITTIQPKHGDSHSAGGENDASLAQIDPATMGSTSPKFPPVKISVFDTNGKPAVGAKVAMRMRNPEQTDSLVDANDSVGANGLAIDRVLPYGKYYVSVATKDGWYASRREVTVEFDKGLDLAFVTPPPNQLATLVLDNGLKLPFESFSELRFGQLEEHNTQYSGWGAVPAPEPGAALGKQASSPTIGNGIDEIAFRLRVQIDQHVKQASGKKLKWLWTPPEHETDEQVLRATDLLLSATEIREVIKSDWKHGSRQDDARFFAFKSRERTTVGYADVSLGQTSRIPYTVQVPAGRLSVYVTDVYGQPHPSVLRAVGLTDSADESQQIWLTADLQENSRWIPCLLDTGNWKPFTWDAAERIVYSPYLAKQVHSVEVDEVLRVAFPKPLVTLDESAEHSLQDSASEQAKQEVEPPFDPANMSGPPFGPRSLDAMTEYYNEVTRPLRIKLFAPPIADLTTEQMKSAIAEAAKWHRKKGKSIIASALEDSVAADRLVDRLDFLGMTGPHSESFRQIIPSLTCETGANHRTLVALSGAELRYSRDGWFSSTWGDLHPPITGTWGLVSVEQRNEPLIQEQFPEWRRDHPKWNQLEIGETSVVFNGDDRRTYEFELDHDTGPLPKFKIGKDGNTKHAGVLMGNGFVDDTKLTIAVDIDGNSTPKTFHTKDGVTTKLTYQRAKTLTGSVESRTQWNLAPGVSPTRILADVQEIAERIRSTELTTDHHKEQ